MELAEPVLGTDERSLEARRRLFAGKFRDLSELPDSDHQQLGSDYWKSKVSLRPDAEAPS